VFETAQNKAAKEQFSSLLHESYGGEVVESRGFLGLLHTGKPIRL
jgi:hypothetical protein